MHGILETIGYGLACRNLGQNILQKESCLPKINTEMLMAMALPALPVFWAKLWAKSAARQPKPPPKIVPIPRFRPLLSVAPAN